MTALLPSLRASIPNTIDADAGDGAHDDHSRLPARGTGRSLIDCSMVLVILVVFVFLRNFRATLIPSVAVPGLAHRHVRLHVSRSAFSINNFTLDGVDDRHGLCRR